MSRNVSPLERIGTLVAVAAVVAALFGGVFVREVDASRGCCGTWSCGGTIPDWPCINEEDCGYQGACCWVC
jgi:hypothetical protein